MWSSRQKLLLLKPLVAINLDYLQGSSQHSTPGPHSLVSVGMAEIDGRGLSVWVYAGPDVEELDGETTNDGGGAFLMCVSELPVKSTKKKDKEVTIGFLVQNTNCLWEDVY